MFLGQSFGCLAQKEDKQAQYPGILSNSFAGVKFWLY
jgi:hypothetical protein